MFLKNRSIISKIKISKVTDYAALKDCSLTVKAATLRRGSAISSAKQGKSVSIYNLVKNK